MHPIIINNDQDDEMVIQSFLCGKGMRVTRFDKQEMGRSKTPDFKVSDPLGNLVFYCEVKSVFEDDWLDIQLDKAFPIDIVGGCRKNPTFNKISKKIHEAAAQFDAINPDLSVPNVLIFVNHEDEDMCGRQDLYSVLTGDFLADSGEKHSIYRRFSDGRIKDEKERIHLYIWFKDGKPLHFHFASQDQVKRDFLNELFVPKGKHKPCEV